MAGGPAIVAQYSADTGKWSAGAKQAKADLKGVRGEFDGLKESSKNASKSIEGYANSFAMRIKKLKMENRSEGENALESFFKGGLVNGGLDLLGAGAGGIIIDQLGAKFSALTANVIKFKQELKEGKITSGELVENIAKGIPVFGGWFEAGRNIRELLTGEKAEVAAILEDSKRQNDLLDHQLANIKLIKDTWAGIDDEIKRVRFDVANIGLDDYHRELLSIEEQNRQALSKIEKDKVDTIKKMDKSKSDAEIKALQDKIADIQAGNYAKGTVTRNLGENPISIEEFRRREVADLTGPLIQQIADAKKKQADAEMELENEYAQLIIEQKLKTSALKADADKRHNQTEYDNLKTAQQAAATAAHEAKIQGLKLAGQDELAQIEDIQYRTDTAMQNNMDKANETIKVRGETKGSAFGRALISRVQSENEALQADAKTRIEGIKKGVKDKLTDIVNDPLEQFRKQIEGLRQKLKDGLINQGEFDLAAKALQDRLVGADIRVPIEIEPDASTPKMQAEFRRFTFAGLTSPGGDNSPENKALKVATDHKGIAAKQLEMMQRTNEILANSPITVASIK